MLRLGLTGGIATGKSSVSALLTRRGLPVIDADQAARAVVAPESAGLQAIVARFGPAVVQPDGSLDRAALRQLVIASPAARQDLEAITHPRIAAHIEAWLDVQEAGGASVAVVDAALMIETGSVARYDAVLIVACSPATQIRRIMARDGHDEATARGWLAAQLPIEEKVRRGLEHPRAAVLYNDGDRAELPGRLDAALAALQVGIASAGPA